MKKIKKLSFILAITLVLASGFLENQTAQASTTPSLGLAGTFGILSSTYTNTVGGTTITGDLGYITGPAVAPTVSGTTHINNATFAQAGSDQASALADLNGQACSRGYSGWNLYSWVLF